MMSSDALEKCLTVLQSAKSDNERFAGLTLVPKIIKAEECDAETRRKIFDAVGFKFLGRLLKSTQAPEGCSLTDYHSLAMTVLACFCTAEELVMDPQMLNKIPIFNEKISSNPSPDDAVGVSMVDDAYQILAAILANPEARNYLIEEHTVTTLCNIYAQQQYGHERSYQLLLALISYCGFQCWEDNTDGLQAILDKLSTDFLLDESEKKFESCRFLSLLVGSTATHQMAALGEQWSTVIHQGLARILQSRIGGEQRVPALKLASAMLDALGIPWALQGTPPNYKFLLILIHLSCIEVRMTVENQEMAQVLEFAGLISSCYCVIENVIEYLTQGPSMLLSEEQVLQLHAAMKGALNSVIWFLSKIDVEHPELTGHALVGASVRVLGLWMAEETVALQEEIFKILPFLMQLSKDSLAAIKDLQESLNNDTLEPKEDATNSAKEVGGESEEDLAVVLSGEKPKPVLTIDVLRFLLPGLCHLTVEDHPRQILYNQGVLPLLVDYFSHQWALWAAGKSNDSKNALVTLCNVLMNCVTVEGGIQADQHTYKKLLSLLSKHTAKLLYEESGVSLLAHFSVLGLMILGATENTGLSDREQEQFLSTILHFLSRVHVLEDGKMAVSPQYAESWMEIEQAWHLGLRVLCSSLMIHRWVVRQVLESAWIPSLTKQLLGAVNGGLDEAVLELYEFFLTTLASTNKHAKKIILEKGGDEVAKKYGWSELGRTLNR